jgi:hypothetical protein
MKNTRSIFIRLLLTHLMKMDQGIAAATFSAPLDIADRVAGQFSLGISQIFWVPMKMDHRTLLNDTF